MPITYGIPKADVRSDLSDIVVRCPNCEWTGKATDGICPNDCSVILCCCCHWPVQSVLSPEELHLARKRKGHTLLPTCVGVELRRYVFRRTTLAILAF